MATPLDPKQIVSFEELLMAQVVQQEVLTQLLVEKRIITKEEFLELYAWNYMPDPSWSLPVLIPSPSSLEM
jgi:hypothetical protein